MNTLFKKLLMVVVFALVLSLAITNMSRASRLITSEDVCYESDPNLPEELPEMTAECLGLGVIAEEDPNVPDTSPEMVPSI